uniref:Uncharacterized protein n=1 Tax=Plectus sambesii TaxID=2011161 RepID=A0A914WWE6_9BILA
MVGRRRPSRYGRMRRKNGSPYPSRRSKEKVVCRHGAAGRRVGQFANWGEFRPGAPKGPALRVPGLPPGCPFLRRRRRCPKRCPWPSDTLPYSKFRTRNTSDERQTTKDKEVQ